MARLGHLATESRVLALLGPAGPLPAAREGDIVAAVLDRTPFHAESGGQDSNAGRITATAAEADVLDVQRPLPGLVVHRIHVTAGELAVGDAVHAAVDPEWRLGARQAHSGTHVLHAALRQILGPTALQSGSYNRPGYLRLDFPWRGALSASARSEIEEAANEALRRDLPVGVRWMPLPQARELGALAPFDETYGEKVRVVEIGGAWSRELCGGTHVEHASQVGVVAHLARATEETMKHQPGFICANFHASQDGRRVINYAQWETEEHYWKMRANPEAQVHMDQAAEIATDVQPSLFEVRSTHGKA